MTTYVTYEPLWGAAEAMEKKYVRGSDVEAVETPDDLLDFFEEIARGEKWGHASVSVWQHPWGDRAEWKS